MPSPVMSNSPPDTLPFDWSILRPAADRLAGALRQSADNCRIALLGLPDDSGILLNRGRPGARLGPQSFREALARYGADHDALLDHPLTTLGIYDAGDVVSPPRSSELLADMLEMHERVTRAVSNLVRQDLITVCIGGGHDLTLPSLRAHIQQLPLGATLAGVNVDAHLDLRETPGSGMPFRSLLELAGPQRFPPARFAEIGLGRFANSLEHIRYARSAGISLTFRERTPDAALLTSLADHLATGPASELLFASFDLDALDAAYAPGVSALNPCGISSTLAAQMCELIGRCQRVRHFDIMELSPPHDVGGRTARLAVHLFLSFLAGVAARR